MVCEIVKRVCVVMFLSLVVACGEVGGVVDDLLGGGVGGSGQCGGASETGSCLRIESIVPDFDGKETSNVDSKQDVCNLTEILTTPGTVPKFEVYKDHNAKITISNRPLTGVQVTDISDVTLEKYAVTYKVNRCPEGASCPINLRDLTGSETIGISANGAVTLTLPFFSIAAREDYNKQGGTNVDYPSYTATYTIIGTDLHKNPVSAVGSAEFTIGNFLRCEGA